MIGKLEAFLDNCIDRDRSVFARALVHGLLAAHSVTTDAGHLVAYRERYPRTAAGYRG